MMKMKENKKVCSVELPREKADKFSNYLKEKEINFEPSEAGVLIHFSCFMTSSELSRANEWLEKL